MAEKKTFKTVRVQPDHTLKVDEVEFPTIADDEVLVKVEAAAINPSDVGYRYGKYLISAEPPYSLGFEGSGIVTEVGKTHSHRIKVGDRVSVVNQHPKFGTWGEYTVVKGDGVFHLHPENSFEEGASHFVNPVTVLLMLEEVKKEGHKVVVHSVGASALGKMLIRLFKENGIKTINFVRRDEAKEELSKLGADYTLNLTDPNFEQEFEEIVKKEHPTKFFDAIGGEFTAKVFRKLPPGSITSIYGLLSQDPKIYLTSFDLFSGKTLSSFVVYFPYNPLPFEEKLKISDEVQKRLKTVFRTDVIKTFSLDKAAEAIESSQKNASLGKTLIKP